MDRRNGTHACENITLPQTSFAGGNNDHTNFEILAIPTTKFVMVEPIVPLQMAFEPVLNCKIIQNLALSPEITKLSNSKYIANGLEAVLSLILRDF